MLPPLSKRQYHLGLQIIGHSFFLLLLAWSVLFYQERMLNFDAAYYSFQVIRNTDFYLPHDRTINYATQWLPILGVKLGWSLPTILLAYSSIFFVLHYAIYNLIVYGFKNVEGGILLALCMCLTIRYKFFAAVSESYISLPLIALLIAYLTRHKDAFRPPKPYWDFMIAAVLVLLASTSHPIAVLPILAYYGFDFFYHRRWSNVWHWTLVGFTLLVFVYRFLSIQNTSYEGRRIEGAWARIENLSSLTELTVWQIVQEYFETEYALAVGVFLILVGILFWRRKILSGLWLILCTVLLLLMILVTYSYLQAKSYLMIDGYLGLLGVVWAIPMLLLVLKSKNYWLGLGLSVVLLGFSLARTYEKHHFFSQRLDYLTYLIEHNGTEQERKLILRLQDFDWSRTWQRWSLPYETLLLSSLEGSENSHTIYVANWNADIEKLMEERYEIYDQMYRIEKFPPQYFQLDTSKYVKITDVPEKK